MFNPFHPFTPELLEAMRAQGKRYYVRQSFGALSVLSSGELSKRHYLMTHYASLVTAKDHYATIQGDPNRFLYDAENEEQLEKLQKAALLNEEYNVFAAVLQKDWERRIPIDLEGKIRSYVEALGWQPKRGDTVKFVFELRFGELYCEMSYRKRKATAKFEDIENQRSCATTSRSRPK